MITLYVRTGCPFCAKVKVFVDDHGILIEEKNIENKNNLEELLTLGGKRQVPFLVDGEVSMYESQDIIDYIEKKYSALNGSAVAPSQKSGGVCPVE